MFSTRPTIEIHSAHAGGAYWKSLTDRFEAAGYKIIEHYGITDAEYRAKRGRLAKLALRLKMYLGYPLKTCLQLLANPQPTPHLKLVITSPFFLPALVSMVSGKRATTINLVNDIFPEALVYSSMIRAEGLLDNALSHVSSHSIRHCNASVFIGKRLRSVSESRYGIAPLSPVIPVGSEGSWFSKPPADIPAERPVRILYSGAMGHMHEIDTLAQFLQQGVPEYVDFRFHSFGSGYNKLKSQIKHSAGIRLEGALGHADWIQAMESSPIALITLRGGAERVSFPSKTFSALMAGQAIIAICSEDSDLACLIRDEDCGWVIPPGDSEGLSTLLASLPRLRSEIARKRLNAYRTGHRDFSMQRVQALWTELFEQLLSHRQSKPETTL